jgi:ABC-2 type transport system permease protein
MRPRARSDVAGAFVYLTLCSLRNQVRVRIRRLREPRYLIGLFAGLAYMYTFIFRHAFASAGRGRPNGALLPLLAQHTETVLMIGSVVFFALAALAWLWPGSRPALLFTRAEVQFLFQAPLTRRQLVHYKLIRSQIGTVFGSAIATVFLRPGSLSAGWTFLVGLWLIFSIIGLHNTGISLSRQSVAKLGVTGLAKQWLPFAVLIASIGILTATVAIDWPRLSSLSNAPEVVDELQRIATTGPAGVVLWPFRAMMRVPLSATPAEFWAALPWVLLILAANYAWVIQADAAFEEAAAARAEKVATRMAAVRAGKLSTPTVKIRPRATASATPFTLSLTGRPETAILWKNLIMVGRYLSLKTLLRFLPVLVLLGVFASGNNHKEGVMTVIAATCLVFVGVTVLLGPQMARNDLRQDLASLAVLKTWPMSGAALLRGELLAPAVVLTLIAWTLTVCGALLTGNLQLDDATALTIALNRLSYAIAAMLVAPGIIMAQLVVQNGLAIMFPAWIAIGASRARGVEVTGQRLLMMAGNIITLLLALLPGAIVGGGVALLIYATTGVVLVVVPALILAMVMLGECWLAVEGLGRVLDRTDVSAVEASE